MPLLPPGRGRLLGIRPLADGSSYAAPPGILARPTVDLGGTLLQERGAAVSAA